jgi:hypothetical protein
VRTEIVVGKEMVAGNRTLHPVIKASIMVTEEGRILGSWIVPLALLIVEPGSYYGISFEGNEMTAKEIIELAPSLKDVIDRGQGIYRIKVT